jgi:hypothetical protein
VHFSEQASSAIAAADPDGRLRLRQLIEQVIGQDPRPGYMDRHPERRRFALRLYDREVLWQIDDDTVEVVAVMPSDQVSESG